MFTINNTKTFKDSVHGYIDIPKCFVESLIDNQYFQRLRNIEQTGMRILYPNAKHDRFTHSLGVFHLGQRAVDDLLENFSKDQYWNIDSDNQSVIFWAKNKILFLIACLLHDIGHAPFSHALESEVLHNSKRPQGKDNNKKKKKQDSQPIESGDYITNKLQEIIYNSEKAYMEHKYNQICNDVSLNISKVAAHEQIGALLVLQDTFKEKIAQIFNNLHSDGFPRPDSEGVLYSEYYEDKIIIDKVDLDNNKSRIIFEDDLCFIARMIMGLKYNDWHPERQIRNCFIELLNGENFDVDKLDYIVRDTQMSGINNISVDVDRLLNSLCIITKTKHFDKLNIEYRKLPQMTIVHIKNNFKNEHLHIDGEFQGQVIIKKGATVTIKEGSKIELLTGVSEFMAKIHYLDSTWARFTANARVYQDSEIVPPDEEGDNKIIQLRGKSGKRMFGTSIKNATLLSDFYFSTDENIILSVREKCDIDIKGEFYSNSSIRLFKAESLKGNISEIEVLSDSFKFDFTKEKVPNEKSYNTFSIGFKKNAINVIANVMDARNYLYLWIYAHHKVIYYANFLIPVLARELFPQKASNEFPNWSLNFDNIQHLDDAYLWTVIKYQDCKKAWGNSAHDKELKLLLTELFTRNYKTSLYKSLAEYDLFFEKYDQITKNKLKEYVSLQLMESKMPAIKVKQKNGKFSHNVGYFKNTEVSKINEKLENILKANFHPEPVPSEYNNLKLKELVYVSAGYKMKQLETLKTFIDMKDDIVPISQIPLLETHTKKYEQNTSNPYFYLYYQTYEKNKLNGENSFIKEAIKIYFEEIVTNKIQKKAKN